MSFTIPPIGAALASDYTGARAALLDRLSLLLAGGAGQLTGANAALLSKLSLLGAGGAGELTAARAVLLDRLDAAISTTAPAGSALSTATWTGARAAFLDRMALIAAGGAGELTAARAVLLDVLSTRIPTMPLVISSIGEYALGPNIAANGNATAPTLAAWMGGGRAGYIPFRVEEKITVAMMVLEVGTQLGNISMGIYNAALALLVTTGAIACPAPGFNVVAIAPTVLNPGRYYMAMSGNNGGMTVRALAGQTGQGLWGYFYENVHPLPANATPGASASVIIPVIGVSLTAAIV